MLSWRWTRGELRDVHTSGGIRVEALRRPSWRAVQMSTADD